MKKLSIDCIFHPIDADPTDINPMCRSETEMKLGREMQPVFAWQSSSMIVVTRLVNNISCRALIVIVSESLELSDGTDVSD